MKNKSTIVFVIIIILVVVGFFAFNSFLKKNINDTTDQTQVVEELVPAIVVPKQAGGKNIFIESAVLKDGGYVVVHRNKDGQPGDVIGVSELLLPGTTDNFLMNIDEEVKEGDSLIATIHKDNGDNVFDITLDSLVVDANGDPVLTKFLIVGEGALDNEVKL